MAALKIGVWMYRDTAGDFVQARLVELLRAGGADVTWDFDMRRCLVVDGHVLSAEGEDLSDLDLLFHMNFDEQTPYQREILRALELSGVRLVNRFEPFVRASDKFVASLLLRRAGLAVPPGMLIDAKTDWNHVERFFARCGSVLVKKRFSAGGKGVIRFDHPDQLREFINATSDHVCDYYLERRIPFVERDARVEFIGGLCTGTYSRALVHDYKTSISFAIDITTRALLGFDAPQEVVAAARKAADVIGVETTIVDLVRSTEDGIYYIIEVNCQLGMFVVAGARSVGLPIRSDFDATYDEDRKLRDLAAYILDQARAAQTSARA